MAYTDFFKRCQSDVSNPSAIKCLKGLGISSELTAKHNIGYDSDTRSLIIPCSEDFYVSYPIIGSDNASTASLCRNSSTKNVALFNEQDLFANNESPIFVTETAIDALAILSSGATAIALNGMSNYTVLLDRFAAGGHFPPLIICFSESFVHTALSSKGVQYIYADVCIGHPSPYDAFVSDPNRFLEAINKAIHRASTMPSTDLPTTYELCHNNNRIPSVSCYITDYMHQEIDALMRHRFGRTGFSTLDNTIGELKRGLYIIGGAPSVGKTTFVSQLADNLVLSKQHVILLSLEQTQQELVFKGICRFANRINPYKSYSANHLLYHTDSDDFKYASSEYARVISDRMYIPDSSQIRNINDLRSIVLKYIDRFQKHPIIIIDHLHRLGTVKDPLTGRFPSSAKEAVETNTRLLKALALEANVPIIAVSMLSRCSYNTYIDMDAFKESGEIEYDADIMLGLQYQIVTDPDFIKEKNLTKKAKMIADARSSRERKVALTVIKNRFGPVGCTIDLLYHPETETFIDPSV